MACGATHTWKTSNKTIKDVWLKGEEEHWMVGGREGRMKGGGGDRGRERA